MSAMPVGHYGYQLAGKGSAAGKKRVSSATTAPNPRAKQPRLMAQQAAKSFGTVLSFNGTKGFGFIAADGGLQADVFFSRDSLLPGTPQQLTGLRVRFELIVNPGTNKPQANNVSLA